MLVKFSYIFIPLIVLRWYFGFYLTLSSISWTFSLWPILILKAPYITLILVYFYLNLILSIFSFSSYFFFSKFILYIGSSSNDYTDVIIESVILLLSSSSSSSSISLSLLLKVNSSFNYNFRGVSSSLYSFIGGTSKGTTTVVFLF